MNAICQFNLKEIIPFSVAEQVLLCVSFSCTDADCLITRIRYSHDENSSKAEDNTQQYTDEVLVFIEKIKSELHDYFTQTAFQFSLPCDLQRGTAFQQRVWQALQAIPSGQVKTYGELAKELDSSPRAVGNACRQNLFPVVIPCHRVISAAGIGGYAGDTLNIQKGQINFLQIKQWLLTHEVSE